MMKLTNAWRLIVVFALALVAANTSLADGTETLADSSDLLAEGTGTLGAGIGLEDGQPKDIEFTVPAGAIVTQVLLYWGTETITGPDDTVFVNDEPVTGTLIGGPAFFFEFGGNAVNASAHRADITTLETFGPGVNTLSIRGLDSQVSTPGTGALGAGVVVIIDDGGPLADIQLVDGLDLAYCGFNEPRKTTVGQIFSVTPDIADRSGALLFHVGSGSSDPIRPTEVRISYDVGTPVSLFNQFNGADGPLWETREIAIPIPAGASEVTVSVQSANPDGTCPGSGLRNASLTWIASTLTVAASPECGDGTTDPGEECDDGNDNDMDTCRNDCTAPFCGDGMTDPGESCDDGNGDDTDACRNDCTLPFCGDGFPDPGEDCDDGNNDPGDGCSEICTFEDADCDISVAKYCEVSRSTGLLCEAKIAATTLEYTGPDALNSTVVFTGKSGGSSVYTNVDLVAGIVLTSVAANGFTLDARPNDLGAKTTITINGVEEVIHTSCSAIYEAGLPAPLDNPKGDPSPNWFVLNFVDKNGTMVAVSSESVEPVSECTIASKNIGKKKKGKKKHSKKKHSKKKHNKKKKHGKKKAAGSMTSDGNEVTYTYVVSNTGGSTLFDIVAFDDVLDREVAGSPIASLEPSESITLTETVEVTETVTNTVFVSGANAAGGICEAEASATVDIQVSCADGDPKTLVFEYTGEGCSAGSNTQEKDECAGSPAGAGDVSIVITHDSSEFTLDTASGIDIGDRVTFSATGSKLGTTTEFDIVDGGGKLQSLNIHTSCSDDLIVGESFGAMKLVGFVPQD